MALWPLFPPKEEFCPLSENTRHIAKIVSFTGYSHCNVYRIFLNSLHQQVIRAYVQGGRPITMVQLAMVRVRATSHLTFDPWPHDPQVAYRYACYCCKYKAHRLQCVSRNAPLSTVSGRQHPRVLTVEKFVGVGAKTWAWLHDNKPCQWSKRPQLITNNFLPHGLFIPKSRCYCWVCGRFSGMVRR